MMPASGLFHGEVIHERLRPRHHKLRYQVSTLLIDLDDAASLAERLRFLSLDRTNMISLHARDHGDGSGEALALQVRALFAGIGLTTVERVMLLAYPRILGAVFNPLSVYLGFARDGRLAGTIYEVNNTFGERTSYVIAVDPDDVSDNGGQMLVRQACDKAMDVSPFTPRLARYGFRLRLAEDLFLGVTVRDQDGALLRAHFRGARAPLHDRAILATVARRPWMTLKVWAAIHWEALRLYAKGVPLTGRHPFPRNPSPGHRVVWVGCGRGEERNAGRQYAGQGTAPGAAHIRSLS